MGKAIRYPARPDGVTKLKDLPPATEAEQAERIAPFLKIVEHSQHAQIRWHDHAGKRRNCRVDLFTAGIVKSVYEAASPDNRAKLMALEPPGIINLCLKAY